MDASQDAIVSIGLVPFSRQRVFLREAHEWLVKPDQPMEEESVMIHGITHSKVRAAPDLEVILEPVLEALAGKVVVVHHRVIERSFFSQSLLARIHEGIQFPVIDTMELEYRALRQRSRAAGSAIAASFRVTAAGRLPPTLFFALLPTSPSAQRCHCHRRAVAGTVKLSIP